jgi:hypothetical protein
LDENNSVFSSIHKTEIEGHLNTPEQIIYSRYSSDMPTRTHVQTPLVSNGSNEWLLRTSNGFVLSNTNNGQQHQRLGTFTPQMRSVHYDREKETISSNKSYTVPMVTIRECSEVKHSLPLTTVPSLKRLTLPITINTYQTPLTYTLPHMYTDISKGYKTNAAYMTHHTQSSYMPMPCNMPVFNYN